MEKHEIDYIKAYQKKGYKGSYRINNGKLADVNTSKEFAPEEIKVVAEHRFEGMSNPDDMSILFVIETPDGGKGTVLTSFGANAGNMALFFSEIPKENIDNSERIEQV